MTLEEARLQFPLLCRFFEARCAFFDPELYAQLRGSFRFDRRLSYDACALEWLSSPHNRRRFIDRIVEYYTTPSNGALTLIEAAVATCLRANPQIIIDIRLAGFRSKVTEAEGDLLRWRQRLQEYEKLVARRA